VIKSFKCSDTERIFKRIFVRKWARDLQERAFAKLNALDAAVNLSDLRLPPSNHLEALKGNRKGQRSIRINDQWRICFEWREGNAEKVEIIDYHSGVSMAKRRISPVHPGFYLKELLEELALSQYKLAREIGIPPMRISHLVNGARPITAELALRLGRYFSQDPRYWLNLQNRYDMDIVEDELGKRVAREVRPFKKVA